MADDKIHIHADSAEQQEGVPEVGPDECPQCKVPYGVCFGLAGGGYGAYTYCPQCYAIMSKTQDRDG